MKEYAIFGAGEYGKRAAASYSFEKIVCFIDNDERKIGTTFLGLPILSLTEYKEKYREVPIIIALRRAKEVKEQLELEEIHNYTIFWGEQEQKTLYPEDILVFNPYEKGNAFWTEPDIVTREYYDLYVEDLYKKNEIFESVEIETYNRCNGGCSFCPVSVKNDIRVEMKMKESVFYKIIDELSEMDYRGRVALFSNNEPFLDDRIIDFHRYARKKLKYARMHLYTNGTKLSLEMYKEIIELLDELVIDNYNQNLELIKNNKIIKEYCEENPELIKKTTIVLRKIDEVLSSRGGTAPNKEKNEEYMSHRCSLPFVQLIIRPDGKVSLCCNDPLGLVTMGDVSKNSLRDVWYNEKYQELRKKIMSGRGNITRCRYCDFLCI